jgi:AcrR family transcriptional regulator
VLATADASSHRERKKQATRDALHAAALDLTEERGLAGVTIEAITTAADVAPRTFFNYFACKEDAVVGYEPGRIERLSAALRDRPAEEPDLEALRHVLLADLSARATDVDLFRRRSDVILSEPQLLAAMGDQYNRMERALVVEIAARRGLDADRDLYPPMIVAAAVGVCRVSVTLWARRGGEGSPAPVVDLAFAQLAAGLPQPEDRRTEPAGRR